MALKQTVLLLLTLTISGCSLLFPKPPEPVQVEIKTVPVKIKITQPVLPRAIDLKEPKWYVVSTANLDEFLQRVEKESGQLVFFAMSVPDYELMAYNMQEIKRYVREMNEIIVYYRTVTMDKPEEESQDEASE